MQTCKNPKLKTEQNTALISKEKSFSKWQHHQAYKTKHLKRQDDNINITQTPPLLV